MSRRLAVVCAALTCTAVVSAHSGAAQTFSTLPSGDVVFTTPYTFTGAFICGAFICGAFTGFVGASCTNTANGVHLTSGNATMDLSFAGASGTLTTSPAGAIPVSMGTITVTTGGTRTFAFPTPVTGYYQWFFQLPVTLSGFGTMPYHFYSSGPTDSIAAAGGAYIVQRITQPQVPGYNYPALVYTGPDVVTIGPNSATFPLVAQVGLVPEPSAFALLGTGLLALIPVIRRGRS